MYFKMIIACLCWKSKFDEFVFVASADGSQGSEAGTPPKKKSSEGKKRGEKSSVLDKFFIEKLTVSYVFSFVWS